MYNSDIPNRSELPSSRQLLRSTIVAVVAASVILVAVVLPAEYAVDLTGIGRALGLTAMGEIKKQLADDAKADPLLDRKASAPAVVPTATQPTDQNSKVAQPAPKVAVSPTPSRRSDEMTVILKPGEGAEIKLVMLQGAKASFAWSVSGGVVNFDLHGDGGGRSTSYQKGRGVSSDEGEIIAAFHGNHGWFWRNRGRANVTVTLRTNGAYSDIKRVI